MSMNNYLFVGLAVAVLALAVGQSFQIRALANNAGGIVGAVTGAVTAVGQINTAGWTADEIMNYEMHGLIPARAQAAPAPQMVGGC